MMLPPEPGMVRWYFEQRRNPLDGLTDEDVLWNEGLWQLMIARREHARSLYGDDLLTAVSEQRKLTREPPVPHSRPQRAAYMREYMRQRRREVRK